MSRADIIDPEVIKGLRATLAGFLKTCDSSIAGHIGALMRMKDQLRGETLSQWKRQVVKREEEYQAARRLWLEVEGDMRDAEQRRGPSKASSVDERVAMDKARRRREAAEEKVVVIQRWLLRLDHDGAALSAQCQGHQLELRERCQDGLRRLDLLYDRVQTYLDASARGQVAAPPSLPDGLSDAPTPATQEPSAPGPIDGSGR